MKGKAIFLIYNIISVLIAITLVFLLRLDLIYLTMIILLLLIVIGFYIFKLQFSKQSSKGDKK